MLLRGKRLSVPKIEIIVIPRNGEDDVIFKAQAIRSFDDFERLCPEPKPPSMIKRGEGVVQNTEDPSYKKAMEAHGQRRIDWTIIESLKATEELVWEQVKPEDSSTWHLYKQELRDSGFGEYELRRIINGVMVANCLDEDKINEARKAFLASQVAGGDQHQSSPNTEPSNGLFGDAANVSVLPLQKSG